MLLKPLFLGCFSEIISFCLGFGIVKCCDQIEFFLVVFKVKDYKLKLLCCMLNETWGKTHEAFLDS